MQRELGHHAGETVKGSSSMQNSMEQWLLITFKGT